MKLVGEDALAGWRREVWVEAASGWDLEESSLI